MDSANYEPVRPVRQGQGRSDSQMELVSPRNFSHDFESLGRSLLPQQSEDLLFKWALYALGATLLTVVACLAAEASVIYSEVVFFKADQNATITSLSNLPDGVVAYYIEHIYNRNFYVSITYHAVFIASLVTGLYFTWDGVHHKNIIQIISMNGYNIALFVYSILQILQIQKDSMDNLLQNNDTGGFLTSQIVLPCAIGIYMPIFAYLTYRMNRDFAWRIFRISGGDKKMDKAFVLYHVYLLFLKFSLFFSGIFTVIDLVLMNVSDTGRKLIIAFSIIMGLAAPFIGFMGVRYENAWCMGAFLLGYVGMVAFVIERMVHALQLQVDELNARAKLAFIMYGVIGVLLLMGAIGSGVVCWRDFGRGLKDVLDQERERGKGDYVPPVRDLDN